MFGLSKQAYYKQIKLNKRRIETRELALASVRQLRRSMPRLGTRKLHYLLKEEKIVIGRDQLFELLRKKNLLITKKRKYTITTNSNHWLHKYPNLILDVIPSRPEQIWVADITYLNTRSKGHLYLHLITDAYSKQIMGYELCDNMEACSTLMALKMALKNRKYKKQHLIHHSDRGLQYCSSLYTSCLLKNNIQISMTQSGDPYENAIAERVNGILKDEFGLDEQLNDIHQAMKQISQSVFAYNNKRPHLSCAMLTPIQMHHQQSLKIKSYKKKSSNIFENA